MDGRALTASELARVAGVTPQTASGQISRMATAGLVSVEKQGRHRYHRLASPVVAQMLETIMQVASGPGATRPPLVVVPRDAALRLARTCYDHLAGRLGVALADTLIEHRYLELTSDGGLVTEGVKFFARLGIEIDGLTLRSRKPSARILCRPCLDWSEPRYHIAGKIARRCAPMPLRRIGSAASTTPERSRSRRLGSGSSERHSA
jgi:DNA-binding transcriptional ArsR family regulator